MTELRRSGAAASSAAQTIPARVVHVLGLRPDTVALRWSRGDCWGAWSFAEMVARAQAVAGSLASLGVAPGDRVLLLLRNQPEFHVADLATQFLRATPVSVYWTASAEQIVHIAAHSEAKVAIVADHLAAERLARAQSDVPTLHQLVVVDNEERSAAPFTWRDLLRGDLVDLESSAASVRPEDLATVIYTSGTTGTPKGVMISQSNVCWTMDCLKQVYAPLELDRARLVSYLPMAHVAERMTTHYPLLAFGTEITCCPEPSAFVDFLPRVRPHLIIGVPRVFEKLADKVNTLAAETDQIPTEREQDRYALIRKRLGLDACRVAVTGAAPTPPDVMSSLQMIGLPLSEGYGLSECCGTATLDPYHSRPGTAGRSAPGSELRISDGGEVLIRGGQVFAGYLKDPQATAEAVDGEGWLHTGDLGEIDADGYLRIIGRIKEIIITSGGKNVAPSYIENKLNSHSLIAYSCVIGDRRPYLTALINADPVAAREWAQSRRLPFRSISEIVGNASFVAEIADAVLRVNATLNRPEQVKRFKIMADEWVPGSALITPTMKVRRTPIIEHYGEVVAQLYDA